MPFFVPSAGFCERGEWLPFSTPGEPFTSLSGLRRAEKAFLLVSFRRRGFRTSTRLFPEWIVLTVFLCVLGCLFLYTSNSFFISGKFLPGLALLVRVFGFPGRNGLGVHDRIMKGSPPRQYPHPIDFEDVHMWNLCPPPQGHSSFGTFLLRSSNRPFPAGHEISLLY